MGDNGKATANKDNAALIAATYQVAQNVQVQLDYQMLSGDANDAAGAQKNRTTLMLFSAF